MNRLNKFVILFVLPFFCLLMSVSNAEIEPNVSYSSYLSSNSSNVSSIGSYSSTQIQTYVDSYIAGTSTELETAMQDLIDNQIISKWYCFQYENYKNLLLVSYGSEIEVFMKKDTLASYICCTNQSGASYYLYTNGYFKKNTNLSGGNVRSLSSSSDTTFYGLDYSVKYLDYISSSNSYSWDGTSYYYEVPTVPDEPDPPSLPSNAEIAQAVQAFYNSDYYKNNKDFEDFIVLYNYDTQYFSFIGHNFEDKFQQLIFPAGYKYKEQWWKFSLDGLGTELSSYILNKYYWLYSTKNFGESIEYDGKGYMQDLLGLNFTTMSTIVYSTNEYDVVVYSYNDNDELTSQMETLPGDQYTYDENLDPTTNEYNPLENFVPTNPSQTILGDVDFDEINKTFEENKGILNIENARWLFTANNQFVGYFIGFLSLLIVFLIISRILGG